jgi:hypothetical protein
MPVPVAPIRPISSTARDGKAKAGGASTIGLAYEQARADGVLRPGIDVAAAARQFVALMDGLQIQWLLSHRHIDMAAILQAHLQTHVTVPLAPGSPIA